MRTAFKEVALVGVKSGRCAVCNGQASRRKRFWQTLNPFNKNANGVPKTKDEILIELMAESDAWEAMPVTHAKCEAA